MLNNKTIKVPEKNIKTFYKILQSWYEILNPYGKDWFDYIKLWNY